MGMGNLTMKTRILIALVCLFTIVAQAKTLIPAYTLATTSGTISGPYKQVTMVFSSDYTGNVLGASFTWAAGGTLTFFANQSSDNIDDIVYTVTAGNIKIITLK